VPRPRRRRQGRDRGDRGARARAHRHQQPEGPLQPRLRLHRDHQEPAGGCPTTTCASRPSLAASAT
jgi:hypothetical protein